MEKANQIAVEEGFEKIQLYVKADNEAALNLYIKSGYEKEGIYNVSTHVYCKWTNPVVSRLMLVRDGKLYLMLRNGHGAAHAGKRWILPGGQTDDGERSVDSVIRETYEEIGLKYKPEQLKIVLEKFDPVWKRHMVFYLANGVPRNPILKEKEKFDACEWIKLEDVELLHNRNGAVLGIYIALAVAAYKARPVLKKW
jgi:8-oxo-dGTP pyrophosphatase MutT (NUDIX family)